MNEGQMKIGINGLGRIGKLCAWHHVGRRYFGEIVINIGREAGTGLADVAHYLERDSTYGSLHAFLHGHNAAPVIEAVDEDAGTMVIDGIPVRVLRSARNPQAIDWKAHDVSLVVDTTGQFPGSDPAGRSRQGIGPGASGIRGRESGRLRTV